MDNSTNIDTLLRNSDKLNSRAWRINNLYSITNRNNEVVKYRENVYQRALRLTIDHLRAEGKQQKIIVAKARQLGITTACLILAIDSFIFEKSRIITNNSDDDLNKEAIQRLSAIYDSCPLRGLAPLKSRNTEQLRSIGYIRCALTARGKTIDFYHVSELAKMDKMKKDLVGDATIGSYPAISPTGTIIIESTGNGVGGMFHSTVAGAQDGTNGFTLLFFPWWLNEEYRSPEGGQGASEVWDHLPSHFLPTPPVIHPTYHHKDEYRDIAVVNGKVGNKAVVYLDEEQINWYTNKRQDYLRDLKVFYQEYPSTIEDVFQGSGSPFYDTDRLNEVVTLPLYEVDEYIDGLTWYASKEECGKWKNALIGIDLAEGLSDGDYSVVRVRTPEGNLLASYRGRRKPDEMLEVIDRIYQSGLTGVIAPERNNHGHAFLAVAKERGVHWYYDIWYEKTMDKVTNTMTKKLGFHSNSATRPVILASHEEAIRLGYIDVDDDLLKEMWTFTNNAKGRPEATVGSHDDVVMADAICWHMRKYPKVRGYK